MSDSKGKRKEVVIKIKSKPRNTTKARDYGKQEKPVLKPRDPKKKGTRGVAWIG